MFNNLCTLLGHHTETGSLNVIWDLLLSRLNESMITAITGKLLQVICIFSTVDGGKKIHDIKKILKAIEAVSLIFLRARVIIRCSN